MMRITLRVSFTFLLIVFILLVNRQLKFINAVHVHLSNTAAHNSNLILDNAGAHIELASSEPTDNDRSRPHIAPVASSSATMTLPSSVQSKARFPLYSKESLASPTRFEPKKIPVQVPGADDDSDSTWNNDFQRVKVGPGLRQKHRRPKPVSPPKPKVTPKSDRIIVVGKLWWEDTDWLEEELPEWQRAIYVIDKPDSEDEEYQVAYNKGKESNVYLQYLIDHYHHLPEYMVFLHAHRSSEHVEFEEQDNVLTVQRLQLDFVNKTGYVNLRCGWEPGCPDEVQPFRQMAGRTTEVAFAGAWMGIFNNTDVPDVIAAPCCAQFAVTRKQVHTRPLSDYQAYHSWLLETQLDDDTSGRVFEYLWHIIFGQDPVFCPPKEQCYRDIYDMEYEEPVVDWYADNPLLGLHEEPVFRN